MLPSTSSSLDTPISVFSTLPLFLLVYVAHPTATGWHPLPRVHLVATRRHRHPGVHQPVHASHWQITDSICCSSTNYYLQGSHSVRPPVLHHGYSHFGIFHPPTFPFLVCCRTLLPPDNTPIQEYTLLPPGDIATNWSMPAKIKSSASLQKNFTMRLAGNLPQILQEVRYSSHILFTCAIEIRYTYKVLRVIIFFMVHNGSTAVWTLRSHLIPSCSNIFTKSLFFLHPLFSPLVLMLKRKNT